MRLNYNNTDLIIFKFTICNHAPMHGVVGSAINDDDDVVYTKLDNRPCYGIWNIRICISLNTKIGTYFKTKTKTACVHLIDTILLQSRRLAFDRGH